MFLWAMVQDAAAKARASLASLFDEHAPFLQRQARRLAAPGVDADDVVQDVFLIAHRRLDDIDPERGAGGWLYGVMRNVLREHARRAGRARRREEAAPEPELVPLPDESADTRARRVRLSRCLQTLPPRQRDAVTLCELEGRSAKEAAALLGTSEAAVFTLLTRGRKALKDAWEASAPASSSGRAA